MLAKEVVHAQVIPKWRRHYINHAGLTTQIEALKYHADLASTFPALYRTVLDEGELALTYYNTQLQRHIALAERALPELSSRQVVQHLLAELAGLLSFSQSNAAILLSLRSTLDTVARDTGISILPEQSTQMELVVENLHIKDKVTQNLLCQIQPLLEAATLAVTVNDIVDRVFARHAIHWAALYVANTELAALVNVPEHLSLVDVDGRTALHFACLSSSASTVRLLQEQGAEWDVVDLENRTPLELALDQSPPNTAFLQEIFQLVPDVFPAALSRIFRDLVRLGEPQLIRNALKPLEAEEARALVNSIDPDSGLTPLHLAAEHDDRADCLAVLLHAGGDVTQKSWWTLQTPVFVATIFGAVKCLELLLDAGSGVSDADHKGWTPFMYAAWKGHSAICKLLPVPLPWTDTSGFVDPRGEYKKPYSQNSKERLFLANRDRLFITILKLNYHRSHPIDNTLLEHTNHHATLFVSAKHVDTDNGSTFKFDVPLSHPDFPVVTFTDASAFSQAVFIFTLDSQVSSSVPSCTAIVTATQLGPGTGEHTALLLNSDFSIAGEITFRFLKVTHYNHANAQDASKRFSLFDRPDRTVPVVIGHRGSGASKYAITSEKLRRTHIQENTILSFVTAGAQGASAVEFDVHWTRDGVPVIYHDFLLKPSGYGIPVDQLTLKEFKALRQQKALVSVTDDAHGTHVRSVGHRRHSVGAASSSEQPAVLYIQDKFPTFEELFLHVPEQVGFNVEIKYPLSSESKMFDMPSKNRELNERIDAALDVIFTHRGNRNIYFSSFNPDVCLALATKQSDFPVMFLTVSGAEQFDEDERTVSVESAFKFAKAYVYGAVFYSAPFVPCPQLIAPIKLGGVAVATWGTANNEPVNVLKQTYFGADGIIVDHVHHIYQNTVA